MTILADRARLIEGRISVGELGSGLFWTHPTRVYNGDETFNQGPTMPTLAEAIIIIVVLLILIFPLHLEWRKRNKPGPQ